MGSILLFTLVTAGALITSLTGLGGGTIILAGLLLVYPPEIAIPLHSFTQLTANSMRTLLFFKTVQWKVVLAYSLLMVPATWAGVAIFEHINPSWLKILVGCFILISIYPFSFRPVGEPKMRTFIFLGALSGFLGVFIGAVGAMLTPFFNRLKISREGMISTKSAGQACLQLSKILAFWGSAAVNFGDLKEHILILVVASLVGVGISIPISRKISDQKFDLIINIILGLIAVKVIYEGINELLIH